MDLSYFLYRVTGMNFIFIFLNLLQPIMVELLLSDFLLGGGDSPWFVLFLILQNFVHILMKL